MFKSNLFKSVVVNVVTALIVAGISLGSAAALIQPVHAQPAYCPGDLKPRLEMTLKNIDPTYGTNKFLTQNGTYDINNVVGIKYTAFTGTYPNTTDFFGRADMISPGMAPYTYTWQLSLQPWPFAIQYAGTYTLNIYTTSGIYCGNASVTLYGVLPTTSPTATPIPTTPRPTNPPTSTPKPTIKPTIKPTTTQKPTTIPTSSVTATPTSTPTEEPTLVGTIIVENTGDRSNVQPGLGAGTDTNQTTTKSNGSQDIVLLIGILILIAAIAGIFILARNRNRYS